ncbi:lactosylceramide 4-alpha-galactosyltransferase-like [Phymastichus coffea]|uniref:lactosylceramide 4-alpha-galactosyltransferase-like n=1 Tax=Phymastichus coffea TaxID=108790 RepID=UPI00273AA003|nr:lactosylceramide 4-alpha-galactosyltransferase-like [Phymastichus coffea]
MKTKKRLALLAVCLLVVALLLLLLGNEQLARTAHLALLGRSADMDVSCYERPAGEHSFPRFDPAEERVRLAGGRNIFFHETSCFAGEGDDGAGAGAEAEAEAELNCRQACAVESAARLNPGMSVNLLFLSAAGPSNRTAGLVDQLLRYGNVRVMRLLVAEYLRDTPLERWFAEGRVLRTSYWPRSHMSDVLRYLTLWKFGGIYLDLDVVVTRSLEDLSNFAGAEDWMDVAAGVIGLAANGLGRRVADACLRDLMRNFRGNLWGNNGPGVITRTLQKFCAVEHAKDMTTERCSGFQVFPPSAFYPIFYKEWRRYFTMIDSNETMQMIEEARAIHVWNKLSASEVVRVGSEVPYALLAQKHCPRIYNSCGPYF